MKRGRKVCGMAPISPDMQGMPSCWTSYINVDDVDAVLAKVSENGGEVTMPAREVPGEGRFAAFADPEGAICGLWQAGNHKGAGVFGEPGALMWNEANIRDGEGARKFYGAVFGWTFKDQKSSTGGLYIEIDVAGTAVGGMLVMEGPQFTGVPASWMAYFGVDDCAAALEKVKELGGKVEMGPVAIEPGRFALVQDPQGAYFMVMDMKEWPS
jgi:predicted enzyme related to lactoylglutathione lyase